MRVMPLLSVRCGVNATAHPFSRLSSFADGGGGSPGFCGVAGEDR